MILRVWDGTMACVDDALVRDRRLKRQTWTVLVAPRAPSPGRCRANMAHMRQSRPDFALAFRSKTSNPFKLFPLRAVVDPKQVRKHQLRSQPPFEQVLWFGVQDSELD